MNLRKGLLLAFFILTLTPVVMVAALLYKSGLSLSTESYMRNLVESINVQADYISQNLESNMVTDYRFANKAMHLSAAAGTESERQEALLSAVQSYLEMSEDRVTTCVLLDEQNTPLYTIGEQSVLDLIFPQLPDFSELTGQTLFEFQLGENSYSLGSITPVYGANRAYQGSMVAIYDKSYIFKIISSYYELSDTATDICRTNGTILNSRGHADEAHRVAVMQALEEMEFASEGRVNTRVDKIPILGYYKNIRNSPWYLVGLIDQAQIFGFTNQFVWVYLMMICAVLVADVALAVYMSKKLANPINDLIAVIDGYPGSLDDTRLIEQVKSGYFETNYLKSKFLSLMKTIRLVQHNFEGIYRLYQSNAMDDTNIDIDTKRQTVHSDKPAFGELMAQLVLPEEACVVERFLHCFCEEDQTMLRDIFEGMRDNHLSVTREAEVFTPHLNQKWFHILVVPMYEGSYLSRIFVQLRDISSFKKQEIESRERANRDALTGLYNRAGFETCVNIVLQRSQKTALHALLFIDMNDFKLVNDNLGHQAGDNLLCEVAGAISRVVGLCDIVSRFGGDEFAVFLPNTSTQAIQMMQQTLEEQLVYPFRTESRSFTVSASIGVATLDHTTIDSLAELLKSADAAMYQEKRRFKQSMGK